MRGRQTPALVDTRQSKINDSLVYEFKLLSQRGCLVLETFSVSHGKAYPYLPLIDLLKNYFQLTNQDEERRRREKTTGRVLTLDRSLEDLLPYLFFLLGIAESTSPLQQMDAQIRRTRILEGIKRLLLRESLNQPLIMIFEDLHWLDAETQAFLQLLSESVATARMLLLVNYRPEYQSPWHGKTYFSQLRLDPLGREQAAEMLATLLDEKGTPARSPLHQFILDKTEGNPFFMEEIVQELREQGVLNDSRRVGTGHQFSDLRLPTTVQGVLSARMDRLMPEEKALLQTLAVIGREFSSSLLHNVVTEREEKLHQMLSRLQAAEFVYEQPAFPEVEYIFKHALTQEVAYNSLLIERRKILHERTALAIEEVYRYKHDDHYSELAYHYSHSGNTQKAVDYLHLAGQQAVQRSAYEEAITHLTTAVELLNTLLHTSDRTRQELALYLSLVPPLIAAKGYASPEVGNAYATVRNLSQQSGDSPHLFPALVGLWVYALIRADLENARVLAEQLMRRAQDLSDPSPLIVEAHWALGETLLYLGELLPARTLLEQGAALYDRQQHGSHAILYGQDPGVFCFVHAAWALWLLGYPDQAKQRAREALMLAQELAQPNDLGNAFTITAMVHLFRREYSIARERAEANVLVATEHGLRFWLAAGTNWRGAALAAEAETLDEGISEILRGLAAWRSIGGVAVCPLIFAFLAEAYGRNAQPEKGLQAIAEAITLVEAHGERREEAELYRLKGELTLQQTNQKAKVKKQKVKITDLRPPTPDPQGEAEACFLKAIDVARKQQARSFELRAAMSLARLWRQQGKRTEAHQILSEIYNWFTEGFETKDLQEAKALLTELVAS